MSEEENKPGAETPEKGEAAEEKASEESTGSSMNDRAEPAPEAEDTVAAKAGTEAPAPAVDPEREAKLKAAAEARAARAAAKAAAEKAKDDAPEEPKPPSVREPELQRLTELIREATAADAVEEAYLNEMNGDMPTLVLQSAHWPAAARLLNEHEELRFVYLRNVSGVDYETHLEVVYHLLSIAGKRDAAIKLRTERDNASVPSATPVWAAANWNEREIYDLLGIDFPGHPDMRRIMMPDDWVGYPLRKDYEPLDSEV